MADPIYMAPRGIGKYPWLIAILGAVAAGLAARFGGGLSGFQSGFIAVVLLIPLLFAVFIFWLATKLGVTKKTEPIVRIAIIAYLVLAFAASCLALNSLFFGRPIRIIPPPAPQSVPRSVRVPVSLGICDAYNPNQAQQDEGKNGFFRIPPHHQAVFVSSESYQWTIDRLDSIEGFLNTCDFVYDLAPFIQQYKSAPVEQDDQKFIDLVIKPLFREFVSEGLASTRPTNQFAFTEAGITTYVTFELLPLIKDPSRRLPESTKAWIRTTEPNQLIGKARIQIWKRIIAHDVLNTSNPDNRIFGPFTDPSNLAKGPSNDPRSGHPTRQAGSGSMVALPLGSALTGAVVPTDNPGIVRFSESGHTITNDTDKPMWVRLGINDGIPEDNGWGYADAHLEIVELRR